MRPGCESNWRHAAERLLVTPCAVLVCLLLAAGPAGAATAIQGLVKDRLTGAALAGAEVEVRRGGELLGHAISDGADGSFLLTVEVGNRPEPTNLKVLVRRDGYQGADDDVVVVSAQPRPAALAVVLLRSNLADCLSRTSPRWVIVGHFRPPLGQPDSDAFSQSVSDAVRWELAKIADTSSLAQDRRPVVVNCGNVDERAFLAAAARLLGADVLLAGGVSRPPDRPRFTVSMFVGDQHGLFDGRSTPITSRDVDLEDPSASRLDRAAAGAIVQAVMTGYRKAGRFEECVELGRRAGAELRPVPPELLPLSQACQQALPANGLRGGTR